MSLLDLMKHNNSNHFNFEKDQFESDLELAIRLSLESSNNDAHLKKQRQQENFEYDEDYEFVIQSQFEEDEKLALTLQSIENSNYVTKSKGKDQRRLLNSFEFNTLNRRYHADDPDGDYQDEIIDDSDDNEEFDYSEPALNYTTVPLEIPLVFDKAQREVDKEIAHITKRDKNKRVNATPVALHHKIYSSRNTGKAIRQDFGLSIVNSTPRPKKIISAQQEGFEYCYGLLLQRVGSRKCLVYCWRDGIERLCSIRNHVFYKGKHWVAKNQIVVMRKRDFQLDRADIVDIVPSDVYYSLIGTPDFPTADIMVSFSKDLIHKIISYLAPEDIIKLIDINSQWSNIISELFPIAKLQLQLENPKGYS